jgi:phosphate transport system permease protein
VISGQGGGATAPPARAQNAAAVPGLRRRSRLIDRASRHVLLAGAGINVVVVALVVIFLLSRAWPTISNIGLGHFFGSANWAPDEGLGFGIGSFGALAPIFGSFAVVTLGLLIAVPFALAVAVFVTETNPIVGERFIRPAVEVFVGIPSVVYGYLGFIALLPLLHNFAPPGRQGSGILAAGIVLAIMVIPTIATISADGLLSVPGALREGSAALGATQWQTIRRVLLPAARPSIVSGIVLGFARAMGEALAVALVIGDVNVIPNFAKEGLGALLEPFTTMTVTITDGVDKLAINPDGTAARYMLAVVLLVVTFLAIIMVRLVTRGRRGSRA